MRHEVLLEFRNVLLEFRLALLEFGLVMLTLYLLAYSIFRKFTHKTWGVIIHRIIRASTSEICAILGSYEQIRIRYAHFQMSYAQLFSSYAHFVTFNLYSRHLKKPRAPVPLAFPFTHSVKRPFRQHMVQLFILTVAQYIFCLHDCMDFTRSFINDRRF